MLRATREPEVIHAERALRARSANLALALRLEREWHNLDKLEAELAMGDHAGERQSYARV